MRHPTHRGLQAERVRWASQRIAQMARDKMGLLIITHHDKLLEHNPPEHTHVILGGRIVESGGVELANELYSKGYERIRQQYPDANAVNQSMEEEDASQVLGT